MMAFAAHRMGISLSVLDPQGSQSPAGQVTSSQQGHYSDPADIKHFAQATSALTYEIEHVDTTHIPAHKALPHPNIIALVQDKLAQKLTYIQHGIHTAPVREIPQSTADPAQFLLNHVLPELGGTFPIMLKNRRMAYDGKGNFLVRRREQLETAIAELGKSSKGGIYAEQFIEFAKEVAVMVYRSKSGEIGCYPVVETIQRDNICDKTILPSGLDAATEKRIIDLSKRVVECLGDGAVGIFGVEMFVTAQGDVLVNEIAPRPHNSGHYTIEACYTDQFEQHLRMILGIPAGDSRARVGHAVMINVLGDGVSGDPSGAQILSRMRMVLGVSGASMHWYGKSGNKLGRKLGHVTVVANSAEELAVRCELVDKILGR
jgi:phosphoribosylaminoimidazole carboxylase